MTVHEFGKDNKEVVVLIHPSIHMPRTVFRKIKNVGHGGLAPFNPKKFARGIEKIINR